MLLHDNIIVNAILIVNAIYYYYHCYLIIAVSDYILSILYSHLLIDDVWIYIWITILN